MPTYRLTTDEGDVVAEQDLDHDQDAVAWRSKHPFESPGVSTGRQLRLERHLDGRWIRLEGLGTAHNG